MWYLTQIMWKLTINLTKLSILTLYLRIFAHTTQRWFRLTILSTMLLVTLYGTASTIVTVFQCNPVHRAWDKSQPGTCVNTTAFWYSNAIYNLSTDFIILVSVPGVIWSLHLPLRQRLALTGVFGLGVFVFATSILRFTTLKLSSHARDSNAGTLTSTMWTTIEANCAIVCACLPMVRTPLQKIWPKFFPNSRAYGTGTTARHTGTNSGVHTDHKHNLDRCLSRTSYHRPTSSQRAMADLRGETVVTATDPFSFREDEQYEDNDQDQIDRTRPMSTKRDEQDLEMGQLPPLPSPPPAVLQQDDGTVQQARWNSPQSWDARLQQQYKQHQIDGAVDDYFFNSHKHDDYPTVQKSSETGRMSSVDSNETDWFAGLPIRPWSYYHSGKGPV